MKAATTMASSFPSFINSYVPAAAGIIEALFRSSGPDQDGAPFNKAHDMAVVPGTGRDLCAEMEPANIIQVQRVSGKVKKFPVISRPDQRGCGNEFLSYLFPFPVEAQVLKPPADVEVTRVPVEVGAQPVVKLEGKNVGSGADLEHEIAGP
jgi:hypothetical protein